MRLCAKQTRVSFPISENKAMNCFNLIHCDIWGAYRIKSFSGAQYFLTIVDDASRGVWVYLMNEKSEASQLLMDFCAMADTQFWGKVNIIRSDNGCEFASNLMKKSYREKGIIHQTSGIDTPQQNGGVERKHRHILSVASRKSSSSFRILREVCFDCCFISLIEHLLLFFREKLHTKFC